MKKFLLFLLVAFFALTLVACDNKQPEMVSYITKNKGTAYGASWADARLVIKNFNNMEESELINIVEYKTKMFDSTARYCNVEIKIFNETSAIITWHMCVDAE